VSLVLKFRYRFEAAHRFLSAQAPSCQTPHGHTWHATAIFRFSESESLDRSAMAAEFGEVKKQWKAFISEVADHSYFHHEQDPIVQTLLRTTPHARLLPFPTDPTTEMIAGLFALKLQCLHKAQLPHSKVDVVGVHIQETPTNSILFKFTADGSAPLWLQDQIKQHRGWWNSSMTDDRSIKSTRR
jgi:6-pyruvoyl-tetrahydropterin synthase